MNPDEKLRFSDALKIANVRLFIGSVGFFTLASRALVVVIGFQIYQLTHDPMMLGWLGLVEAAPALSLVLFGGYFADHFDRKKILLITRAVSFLCALTLSWLSFGGHQPYTLIGLYAVIFLAGIARGFADPANTAFEAQIVPRHLTVNASSWISSSWTVCGILGPAIIGFVYAAWQAAGAYVVITFSFLFSWLCTLAIQAKPQSTPEKKEPILKSISIGWQYVFNHKPLLHALSLDLFAVLFGGAMALLPLFAQDILHVGPQGLGLLSAAPSMGAICIMLLATHRPPIANAGRNLLLAVFGFGISMIVFAFSKNFWLSMIALFFSGIFDGVSMVIRRSMIRLLSPDGLRGRIAATSWIFICSSNELGAFESGFVAAWIGAVPCVALGGTITLGIVGLAAVLAKELKNLRFNPKTLEKN